MFYIKKYISLVTVAIFLIFTICIENFSVSAGNGKIISGTSYELTGEYSYRISDSEIKENLCYGKSAMGTLQLQGNINNTEKYNMFSAYYASGGISFVYSCPDSYLTDDEDNWHLVTIQSLKNSIMLKVKKMNKKNCEFTSIHKNPNVVY
jgi:hypothetical protein